MTDIVDELFAVWQDKTVPVDAANVASKAANDIKQLRAENKDKDVRLANLRSQLALYRSDYERVNAFRDDNAKLRQEREKLRAEKADLSGAMQAMRDGANTEIERLRLKITQLEQDSAELQAVENENEQLRARVHELEAELRNIF